MTRLPILAALLLLPAVCLAAPPAEGQFIPTEAEKKVAAAGGQYPVGYVTNAGQFLVLSAKLKPEEWGLLKDLSRTEMLSIEFEGLDASIIEQIGKMPKLSTLFIRKGKLEDAQWKALAQLKSLSELNLQSDDISHAHIIGMPGIKNITVYSSTLETVEIRDCPQLYILYAAVKKTDGADAAQEQLRQVHFQLADAPKLGYLTLANMRCEDLRLADLKSLQSITLGRRLEWKNENDASLSIAAPLTSLDVDESSMTKTLAQSLRGNKNIISLKLKSDDPARSFDAILSQFDDFPELKILECSYGRISTDGIARLKSPKLSTLTMNDCAISGDPALVTANLGQLRDLHVARSTLHINLYNALAALPGVRSVYKDGVKLVGNPAKTEKDGK